MSAQTMEQRINDQLRDAPIAAPIASIPSNYRSAAKKLAPLVARDFSDFMATTFPPRENILEPIIVTRSLTMIYGPRGIGKTFFSLYMALAIASGSSWLGWKASRAFKVLYIDGEMPAHVLQTRLEGVTRTLGIAPQPGYLKIITPDLLSRPAPDLASLEDQALVDQIAADVDVIFVDNLSCLYRSGGEENSSESVQFIADWALPHRSAGRAVVLIHHAGKNGQQRGTSKREDLLDVVIALRRPQDHSPQHGARFEVHFEKARHLFGADVEPFEAALSTDANGNQQWASRSLEGTLDARLIELGALGLSVTDMAKELGCSKGTVSKHIKSMKEAKAWPHAKP